MLHGISLEVQDSSIGCTNVQISIIGPARAPDERAGASHLLVLHNDLKSEQDSLQSARDAGTKVYGRDCCFGIDSRGIFVRFTYLDSSHCESETAVFYAMKQQFKVISQQSVAIDCDILLISKDSDCAMIALLQNHLKWKKPWHRLGDTFRNIDGLHSFQESLNLPNISLVCCYVLAGCDFTPYTRHVNHKAYLNALLLNADYFKSLSDCSPTVLYEVLTALAYLHCRKTRSLDSIGKPHLRIDPMKLTTACIEETKVWNNDVRRWVDGLISTKNVTMLMPYEEAIEMQAKRVRWVLDYWRQAEEKCCDVTTVAASDGSTGFRQNVLPSFETSEDIQKKTVIIELQTQACGCKKGCKASCGCRKIQRVCIACHCEASTCTNTIERSGDASENY